MVKLFEFNNNENQIKEVDTNFVESNYISKNKIIWYSSLNIDCKNDKNQILFKNLLMKIKNKSFNF